MLLSVANSMLKQFSNEKNSVLQVISEKNVLKIFPDKKYNVL